jgi:hypothetical protein
MWFVTVISSFYFWWARFFNLLEVASLPGTGCMVPTLYAAVGNWSHSGVLGCNWWPVVPKVNYLDNSPQALR